MAKGVAQLPPGMWRGVEGGGSHKHHLASRALLAGLTIFVHKKRHRPKKVSGAQSRVDDSVLASGGHDFLGNRDVEIRWQW